ncbi:hypothetical protein COMNV_01721 [Commensalibacter sp. Nvir]|uniref:NAD(P)H-dependent flavin oxidoreductase n=1 Tax=Commensalibacter sp. Nvir TaxID=3069817 RepID=UPI002D4B2F14|nr:hypothetical protein COMNV_01721 [Commensalibacter sp. Nvir]
MNNKSIAFHSDFQRRAQEELFCLWKRGIDFLGSRFAILGGAMSWVSERNLVSAISNAGGFGVLACGAMEPYLLEKEIVATQALTNKPFGVNLITMHPKIDELIEVCLNLKINHIVLAGGIPTGSSIKRIKDGGSKVIAFAPALVLAKRLIKFGVDALVIEGTEAGGHIGPVSLTVLAQEILPVIKEVPVFVAGGLGRGEAILSYLELGASGAQLGTSFAACLESQAHENFKKSFIYASARDAVVSLQIDEAFPVIPVRALSNKATKAFMSHQAAVIKRFNNNEISKEEAQLSIEHFWAGALRKAVKDGDVENGSVMAGQSVGMVKQILPVKEIIEILVKQAESALVARYKRLSD